MWTVRKVLYNQVRLPMHWSLCPYAFIIFPSCTHYQIFIPVNNMYLLNMEPSLTYDKYTKWRGTAFRCYIVMLGAVYCMRQSIFWQLKMLPSSGKIHIIECTPFGLLHTANLSPGIEVSVHIFQTMQCYITAEGYLLSHPCNKLKILLLTQVLRQ